MTYPDLEIIVISVCDAISAVAELVAHEGIFALLKYAGDLSALGTLSLDQIKLELAALTPTERLTLENLAKAKLKNVPQAGLQLKLDSGIDLLELIVQYGYEIYSQYQKGVALFEKAKSLVTT